MHHIHLTPPQADKLIAGREGAEYHAVHYLPSNATVKATGKPKETRLTLRPSTKLFGGASLHSLADNHLLRFTVGGVAHQRFSTTPNCLIFKAETALQVWGSVGGALLTHW